MEKWENAYLSAKSATASGAPAYRVLYLKTKPNEQIGPLSFSDVFVKNGQNLSYLNRYFVMYPHKATVKN